MSEEQAERQSNTPSSAGTLAGQVAIITGASRGIGAAAAHVFARAGAAVALAARDAARIEANARAITADGGRAMAVPVDVTDEASVAALFTNVAQRFGEASILVNCAGAFAGAPFAEMALATWERVLAVNVRGTFLCCREAFRRMPARGGGVILNLSSLGGLERTEKFAGNSAYTVSKFGVTGLSEALAVEGKPLGIRVVAVSPGAVDTEMLREAAPHLRPGTTPEEVARILLFLAGPDARALGGTNLAIFSNA